MLKKTIIAAFVIAAVSLPANAAVYGVSSVTAALGYIETFHRDDPNYSNAYTFYPELQVTGPLPFRSFFWVLYGGYWDDGVDSPVAPDYPTYSFKGSIAGVRVLFKPSKMSDNWPLPAGVFAGFSRHFITMDYLGGDDDAGVPATYDDTSNTFEFGLNLDYPLGGMFKLRGEVRQFVPFSGDDFEDVQKSRRAYTIGISLSF